MQLFDLTNNRASRPARRTTFRYRINRATLWHNETKPTVGSRRPPSGRDRSNNKHVGSAFFPAFWLKFPENLIQEACSRS